MRVLLAIWVLVGCSMLSCKKNDGNNTPLPPPPPAALLLQSATVNGAVGPNFINVSRRPVIRFEFSDTVNTATAAGAISFASAAGAGIPFGISWEAGNRIMNLQPEAGRLAGLEQYTITVSNALRSKNGGALTDAVQLRIITQIDSTRKFPVLSDDSLLTLIQKQTFRYFWDFGHPVSGMARERNTSGDLVTTGGSGFGVMAMITAVNRGFITRQQALERITTMVDFLQHKAQRFKGAYPHWLNGISGVVIPFSANDNGADLVETSFLAMGLLSARQFFSQPAAAETSLRDSINAIVDSIQWNWFRRGNEDVLYWHWSPDKGWAMNLKIQGWNECLITYVLAASSKHYAIPQSVYQKGWTRDGAFRNGKTFFGTVLPLGSDMGGPLFLSQYSFLGINPNGLSDAFANYKTQQVAHSLINQAYCRQNPQNRWGYSDSCWGLTASDIPGSYTASSPANDVGVIAPTAAISAMPFVPQESMKAIRFFYEVLGDKIWKEYGFTDAFRLSDLWFASSFLAIDQGPQIVMIENHRSGLLWQLFTSCPEVRVGMKQLGFTAPYL